MGKGSTFNMELYAQSQASMENYMESVAAHGTVNNSSYNGKHPRKPGDDCNGYQPKPTGKPENTVKLLQQLHMQPLVHSSKTAAIMRQIQEWLKEAPDDKILGKRLSSISKSRY